MFGSLISDIDRISESCLDTDDDTIDRSVVALHEDIWKVFEETKNDQLDALLRGEKHELAA